MKLFARTAAAFVFTASAAMAEDAATPKLEEGQILFQDDSVIVVVDPTLKNQQVNDFFVACPGFITLQSQFAGHHGAVVGLFQKTSHEDVHKMAQSIYDVADITNIDIETTHFPQGNYGTIGLDGSVRPAYTFREGLDLLSDFLKQAEPLPTINPANPVLIERLRSHAVNFCFARY